ncbi:MAG: DUF4388 domain-containing protein [Cyanobacteria bacterium J06636_16]
MYIQGSLADFSLPEVFQFLEQGKKTGRLFIQPTEIRTDNELFFVWLHKGRIVAAANRLDGLGLISILQERYRLKPQMIPRLIQQCPSYMPLGQYLQRNQVLQPKHVKALFALQVIRQTCKLFKLTEARFRFTDEAPLPQFEMTGLSVPATEITLPALRSLQDWQSLAAKLPYEQSGLKQLVKQPKLRLNQSEQRLWQVIDGQQTLVQLAQKLTLPLEDVQKIAFRLIFVGLVGELPLVSTMTTISNKSPSPFQKLADSDATFKVSPRFLDSLYSYLKKSR